MRQGLQRENERSTVPIEQAIFGKKFKLQCSGRKLDFHGIATRPIFPRPRVGPLHGQARRTSREVRRYGQVHEAK